MRQNIVDLARRREAGQHPGLLLSRFLVSHDDKGDDKRLLFIAARTASRNAALSALYRLAYTRWRDNLPATGLAETLATPPHNRLIVGLGQKGVVEAGLRLHHTYGVPLVPGSALKGLVSHYCAEVWGKSEPRYAREGDYHELLFGTTDDSGVIRFDDAWMLPESLADGILGDVMTPHHQEWQTNPDAAPTDFDSPDPVPFLSVAGRFHVAIDWQGPDDDQATAWTKRAMDLLQAALADWGVGGKTSSGYGRLVKPDAKGGAALATQAGQKKDKRDSGVPASVTIVGPRPSGFDVQEEGRPTGTLTLGTAPPGVVTAVGSVANVLVHNDDPKKPQYKWPNPPKQPTKGGGK